MNKNKKIYQALIIILFVIIIIIGISINDNYNNNEEPTTVSEYANLNIDKEKLNIFYLNVGQADSTLITINDYTMLIDSGNESDGYYITQFLKAQNITQIDYFVLTHLDSDHIGGAYKILEELEIGVLYMPSNSNDTQTYRDLLTSIDVNNINTDTTLKASNDKTYSLGQANWKVLNVNDGNNLNDSSIVIELSFENTKYLFMGDATTNIEKNQDIKWNEVDVLKVAHHGSNSSTSQDFLNIINPKYAIISVGTDNGDDHPDKNVLERLKNHKSIIKTYRTDEDDTIWITSDGNEVKVECIEYNLDGKGRKQAFIFERVCLAFFSCTYNMV